MFYFLIGISTAFCSAVDQDKNTKLMDVHIQNVVTSSSNTLTFIDTETPHIAAQHDNKNARFSQFAKIPFIKTDKPIKYTPFDTSKKNN